jgi:hypothetical protein
MQRTNCVTPNTINLWIIYKKDQRLPHVAQNRGNNEWYTPKEYITAATAVMGEIDLDPASAIPANKVVCAKTFHIAEDNGLTKSWRGRVWMNPPYAAKLISKFCDKLVEHFVSGDVIEAIVLVNNATETRWFKKLMSCASAVMFPKSRIKFWSYDGRKSAPLQGQSVIYLGRNVKSFVEHFHQFGWIGIQSHERIENNRAA